MRRGEHNTLYEVFRTVLNKDRKATLAAELPEINVIVAEGGSRNQQSAVRVKGLLLWAPLEASRFGNFDLEAGDLIRFDRHENREIFFQMSELEIEPACNIACRGELAD